MKFPTRSVAPVVIAFSAGVVVMITWVHHHAIPERAEIMIRSVAEKMGFVAVPIFIVLAWCAWAKTCRLELPSWRNSLGIASIAILSLTWSFFAGLKILEASNPAAARFFGAGWMAILLSSTLLAAALAVALKGASRAQGIAAALLIWAWLQSTIYF